MAQRAGDMIVKYAPNFLKKLKSVNVRIRKSFAERIAHFRRDPFYLQLNNHALKDEYEGCRSIDITNDYRAIYEEVQSGNDVVAYFFLLGTHEELY